jgi:hypothetical protein
MSSNDHTQPLVIDDTFTVSSLKVPAPSWANIGTYVLICDFLIKAYSFTRPIKGIVPATYTYAYSDTPVTVPDNPKSSFAMHGPNRGTLGFVDFASATQNPPKIGSAFSSISNQQLLYFGGGFLVVSAALSIIIYAIRYFTDRIEMKIQKAGKNYHVSRKQDGNHRV